MAGIPAIEPYALPEPGELPPSAVDWQVDPQRSVLLLHDMQEYFLNAFPRHAGPREALIRNAALIRRHCAALDVPIAYTAQPGGMTPAQRGLLSDFWGPGMRTSSEHRRVVRPLAPDDGDWVLTKWRYSAFFKSELLRRMRAHGRDQLVICGVYAHIGVLMTAVDAFTHDIQSFVVADAVGDFSAAYHRLALDYAAQRCARVVATKSVIDALDTARPGSAPRSVDL
ncbi:putative isochorismatase (phenazine biosynthesis) PhzD [Streptomyces longispororuber]|uniref:Isochorismatase (Phenazine biosynthesis) PhzD n=1 Tax=Streptomyces longispororuber TaxID=68230 RepID=A0A919DK14_9ACTN|nr:MULTISPECIES: isochorismatase family protein [Streptomyces]GHE49756.1 putative isochorismatase (phenazine biosynthesis) PhzD [Streptomyces longispororuber]